MSVMDDYELYDNYDTGCLCIFLLAGVLEIDRFPSLIIFVFGRYLMVGDIMIQYQWRLERICTTCGGVTSLDLQMARSTSRHHLLHLSRNVHNFNSNLLKAEN